MSLLLHTFLNSDKLTVLLSLFMVIWAIVLIIIHAIIKKNDGRMWGWRLLCLVPLVLCIVHFITHMVHGMPMMTLGCYIFLYALAIPFILWLFFANRKIGHRIVAVLVMLLVIPLSLASSLMTLMQKTYNLSDKSYTEAFKGLISIMKEDYVLTEWKETDLDAIQAELMPLVEEAERDHDEAKFGEVLQRLCYLTHDDHIGFGMETEPLETMRENLAGDDHGFIMMTLSNGDTAAYMVEEGSDAYKAGIRNGTVIKKWNGTDINKAKSETECIYTRLSNFPVKENEEMYQALMLAGTGGKTVEVTFVDESGKEKTATVTSDKSYRPRLNEAIMKFNHQLEDEDMTADNFSTKMLDDHTGYLRVNGETYNTLKDVLNLIGGGDYPEVRELVRSRLDDLKAQGMTCLVIDVRNNSGGFDEISGAVTSMFTDEKMFINSMAERDGNSYTVYYKHYLNPDGTYKDMPVAVLTNVGCCSAGDGLVYDLSRCPNVTVMGMTHSAGVNQFLCTQMFLTDGRFMFAFPNLYSLEENGSEIFIDTKADRISRNPNDIMIPVTDDACKTIFGDSGKDYELEYAVEFLNRAK